MITVVGKESCPKCHTIRDIFSKREIEYVYIDYEKHEDQDIWYSRIMQENNGYVPMILKDNVRVDFKTILEGE